MTIKDIARESGYAVGTVSRVLNDCPGVSPKARERILEVVAQNHFSLNSNAKHLKQQASSGVAIVVKGTHNMLFASIVEDLQRLIKEKGCPSLIYYFDEDENEVVHALKICRERKPLGILFLGSTFSHFEEHFSEISIPCVMVTNCASPLGYGNLSSVSTDDTAAADYAISHLIALGHRKIGILGGKMERSQASSARFMGCQRAFFRHHIPFDPEAHYEISRFSLSGGYHAMERLLDKMPELTAVFAMSDVTAVGAIRAIRDRGLKVPEDISVMGFDGVELGGFLSPKLTTIQQDAPRLARRALELLLSALEEDGPAVHELVPFRLLPGESVHPL